ncbi:SIMPL domain-containing protein [Patescibacteria group bacterium]|nr:SIMPL domain-containing protein [Patescibacteria group bacterium]
MKEFKKPFLLILFLFLSLFIFTKFFGPIPFSVTSTVTTKSNFFTSTGQGEATGIPDTARVSIGVAQQGQSVEQTQEKTNQLAERVIEEIKKLGIGEKDIKTTNYSINPRQDFSAGSNKIIGYEATQNLEISTKDTTKINQVVDVATLNGANLVGGVQFIFSPEKQKEIEKKAREEAVRNAKEKAQSLANAAGISLGKIVDVQENSGIESPRLLMQKADLEINDRTNTNITPGENKVIVTITLSYETK